MLHCAFCNVIDDFFCVKKFITVSNVSNLKKHMRSTFNASCYVEKMFLKYKSFRSYS